LAKSKLHARYKSTGPDDGIWADFGDGIAVKVRMFKSPFVQAFQKSLHRPYADMVRRGPLPQNIAEEVMERLIAGAVIVDWRGVTDEEPEQIDDEVVRELVQQNRALYEAAVAAGNIGAARKSLTAIERLLKKKAKKPTPATPPPPTPAKPSRWTMAELVDMLLTPEDEAEIAAMYPAHVEEERGKWLRGEPNDYWEVA
jgi:hypothetical protein